MCYYLKKQKDINGKLGEILGEFPLILTVEVLKQDERWMKNYQEVKDFIEKYHRNPSRHRIEEHLLLNWVKQQRKLLNAGVLKPERVERFKELMELIEENKRVNQYG